MVILTRAAGFVAMCLLVFACSTGASSSATTGTGGSDAAQAIVDKYCNTIAQPLCEADYACCQSTLGRVADSFDIDDATGIKACEKWVSQGYSQSLCSPFAARDHFGDVAAALREGVVVFDQAQFDTCLALLKSMTAGGAACTEPPLPVALTICSTAFRGQIAAGEPCPFPGLYYKFDSFGAAIPCKDGRCENSICIPFLKTGDACDLETAHQFDMAASRLCNFRNREVCWGVLNKGGAAGDGGVGGAAPMGTCRPEGELGDACDPGNPEECKSQTCDATGHCVPPTPEQSACFGY